MGQEKNRRVFGAVLRLTVIKPLDELTTVLHTY